MLTVAHAISSFLSAELRTTLCDAVRNGELARNHNTRRGYPLNYPGQAAYAERVRYLNALLCPAGWERTDHEQQAAFTSPSKELRIITMTGDDATGRAGGEGPRTRPRGPRTQEAIQQNALIVGQQLSLFSQEASIEPLSLILMVYRDQGADRVRAELSVATEMRRQGASVAYDWVWRELLLDEALGDSPGSEAPPEAPAPIDFDIEEL